MFVEEGRVNRAVSSLSVSSQRGDSVAARACEMMSARRIGISIETATGRITLETLIPRFEIAGSLAAPRIASEPSLARIPQLPLGEQRDRHLWSDLKPGSISRRPAGQGRVASGLRTGRSVGLTRRHAASWLSAPRNLRRRWQGRALRRAQPRPLPRAGGRDISRSFRPRSSCLDPIRSGIQLRPSRGSSPGALPGRRGLLSLVYEQLRALLRVVSARRASQPSSGSVADAAKKGAAGDDRLDRGGALPNGTKAASGSLSRCL